MTLNVTSVGLFILVDCAKPNGQVGKKGKKEESAGNNLNETFRLNK